MSRLHWFKHYNTAHEGQLIGDLIITGKHEAALLVYVIMELISRFEDPDERGRASIPVERIARAMNMKPSKIDRLLAEISAVSRSDLVCEMEEERPRNRSFLMRNWLKYQETRGGKREAKSEQSCGRREKVEGRSKNKEYMSSGDDVTVASHEVSLAGASGCLADASEVVVEKPDGGIQFKPSDLLSLWNDLADPALARAFKLTPKRTSQAKRILKDYPDKDFWENLMNVINASQFLCGRVKATGARESAWRCDFDFILKPDNVLKIVEGKYE